MTTVSTTVFRLREISCDGAKPGCEHRSAYFFTKKLAEDTLHNWICQYNTRNPKYKFNTKLETLDGVTGYCNWQFGIMITLDTVEVKNGA